MPILVNKYFSVHFRHYYKKVLEKTYYPQSLIDSIGEKLQMPLNTSFKGAEYFVLEYIKGNCVSFPKQQ